MTAQPFATGEALAWWARVELPGARVDRWLAGGPLRRAEVRRAHPVLCCALRAWAVRPLHPDHRIAEGAPRPLRPLARRACRHRAVRALATGVRLRFVEWVVLVPELTLPGVAEPVAALPRGWLSSRAGARHDRARLGLDLRTRGVRLRIDTQAGARGSLEGAAVRLEAEGPGTVDVMAPLAQHRICGLSGTALFTNVLEVEHCEARVGTVALGAGLLPDGAALIEKAQLTRTRHRWTLTGPLDDDAGGRQLKRR